MYRVIEIGGTFHAKDIGNGLEGLSKKELKDADDFVNEERAVVFVENLEVLYEFLGTDDIELHREED